VNLLSVSEKIAAIDHLKVWFHAETCLYSQDKFSECQECATVCPVDAIQVGKPPQFEAQKCLNCLACLPVCTAGAFRGDDAILDLLQCAARLETHAVELICEHHPSPQIGLRDFGTAIQVKGCLAGIGVGGYLALVALGKNAAIARTDACGDCTLGSLLIQIETQIAAVQKILSAWMIDPVPSTLGTIEHQAMVERPFWQAANPPISRRELFQMATRMGQLAAARVLSTDHPSTGKHPPRERQRLINAIAHLPGLPAENAEPPLEGLGFAMLSISVRCTACGACARVCPSGALQFYNDGDQHFRLTFQAWSCIACGACTRLCEPNAIEMRNSATFHQLFGDEATQLLISGDLARCQHCQTLFAARPDTQLCSLCEFRSKNLFGSRLPPGFQPGRRMRQIYDP
jgi:ferredoxin